MSLRPLLLVALVALVVGTAPAQESMFDDPTEPTSRGDWFGTWIHKSRDFNFALWIRPGPDGLPQLKFQYLGLGKAEGFATGWDEPVRYGLRRGEGQFGVALTARSADRLEGRWEWTVDLGSSGREEHGVFSMYRVFDGRTLYIDYSQMEKVLRREGKESRMQLPHKLAFRKVSRRVVDWEEISF